MRVTFFIPFWNYSYLPTYTALSISEKDATSTVFYIIKFKKNPFKTATAYMVIRVPRLLGFLEYKAWVSKDIVVII